MKSPMLGRITITALLAVLCTLRVGCAGMLDPQAAKDRDLGHVVEENLKTGNLFRDNIVSFSLVESGVYRCVTKNLTTADDVGRFAYNVMVSLDERNNTKVRTGRSEFRIVGEQDGTQIFEVTMVAGDRPKVTLMGPFEGEEWSLSSGRR